MVEIRGDHRLEAPVAVRLVDHLAHVVVDLGVIGPLLTRALEHAHHAEEEIDLRKVKQGVHGGVVLVAETDARGTVGALALLGAQLPDAVVPA